MLARIAVGDGAAADVAAPAPQAPAARRGAVPTRRRAATALPPPQGQPARPAAGRRYSPVVQRIAAEHGIDLSNVDGHRARRARAQAGRDGAGRRRRQRRRRGRGAAAHREPVPARPRAGCGPAGVTSSGEGLSRMRRQIGEHMKRSLDTAATCTTWIEVDMSRVEAARRRLGVTGLAFVARATIAALREYPALNAWLEGESYTRVNEVNLGIAVSLGDDGLIVPVIHNAHELSEEGLAARIKDVARRARARELTARRRPGRHLHDHQPRPVRLDHGDADHQPAPGRDPRLRGGGQAARWWSPTPTATTRSRSAR